MASTFTTLGIEKMATGENAGTWGDKTNTNLDIVNTAIAGYVEQSIAGSADTTALTITDGAATATLQNAVIKFTGTISGNQVVTIPDSIEKTFIIVNGTSGAFTVQVKTVSGTGVIFGVSEKSTKLLFSDGTNIVDAGFSGALDIEGRELVLDADGDTSLTADTDDQIDIKIAGADDFRFTANTFTALSGSTFVGNLTGNASGTAATVTTAAQSNITSLGTLTTLTVDNIITNGSNIGHTSDTDLITLADGIATVAGEVSMTTLDIGGTNVTSTAAELNILDGVTATATELNLIDGVTATTAELNILAGVTSTAAELNLLDGVSGLVKADLTKLAAVDSTAAELNIVDGGTSATSTTIVDADRVVLNDNGTMVQVAVTDIKSYVGSASGAFSVANLDIDGATDIGADIVDADLFIIDDGASGTNRKTTAARIKTYTNADLADPTALAIALG